MRFYIIFSLIFVLTIAIRERRHECFTCDDFCECISPRISLCPPETKCYTLRSKNGDIEHMGCALSCNSVNRASYEKCEECVGDLCALPNLKIDIDSEKCLNRKFGGSKRDIGGGATFDNHHEIGGGVEPGNNGIGQGVNFNNDEFGDNSNGGGIGIGGGAAPGNGGIGNGAAPGNGGIGHGANPGGVGIGGGAAPGNVGIGHGANPGQVGIGGGAFFGKPHRDGSGRHYPVGRDIGDGVQPGYRTPIGTGVNPFSNNTQKINLSNVLHIIFLTLTFIFYLSN